MRASTQHTCKHCGDAIERWTCHSCKRQREISDQCKLCHDELVHDKIVPQFMRPQFGGRDDPCWSDDEDAQGYGALARKLMEDG
jgi:hypothetical protein